jgi:hypothetical protein
VLDGGVEMDDRTGGLGYVKEGGTNEKPFPLLLLSAVTGYADKTCSCR